VARFLSSLNLSVCCTPGGMTSSPARLRRFVAEAADAVTKTASSIADSTKATSIVEVCQDRRGWEIHATVAIEDQHCVKELLDVAKDHLQAACQSTRYVCLVSNHMWKDVQYGLRGLLAFVEDETRASTPICELQKCPNPECPARHARLIKRFYVTVKPNMVISKFGSSGNKWDHGMPSCSAPTSISAPDTRAPSARNLSPINYSGLSNRLFQDDGSIAAEDGPLPLSCHTVHDTNFGLPRGIQARQPDQSSFDLIQSPWRPCCVISV